MRIQALREQVYSPDVTYGDVIVDITLIGSPDCIRVDGVKVWPLPDPPLPTPPPESPSRFKVGDRVVLVCNVSNKATVRATFANSLGVRCVSVEWDQGGVEALHEDRLILIVSPAPGPPKTLGELFRRAREAKGWTHEQAKQAFSDRWPHTKGVDRVDLCEGQNSTLAYTGGWLVKLVTLYAIDPAEFHRVALAEMEAGK